MNRAFLCGISLLLSIFAGNAVQASPYFRIGSYEDWQSALRNGTVRPVEAAAFESMVREETAWPSDYRGATFYTPTLEARENLEGKPALYMGWGSGTGVPGPSANGQYMAAAWDYTYALDPNLNNTRIEFSIFPPSPSTLFSLNLIDGNGNYREWIWHAPANPGVNDPIAGIWNTVIIDPVSGWSNLNTFGGSPFIHNVPGSVFDLGSVTILRFDENISTFTPGPGGIPDNWRWNAWDHVSVTPEPETYAMLLAGLAALGFVARRRTRTAA